MEFLDADVKTMPSLSYTEYLEGIQSYECQDCKKIIYPEMERYCRECVKTNLKHLPIFCCECRTPIEYKTDYLLNNNEVSELPQVYLLCNCSKGLWLPFAKGGITTTSDHFIEDVRWYLCNPSLSKYANNNRVYFLKCQKKEEDLFLQSYIKANIDPDRKMGGELESLSKDYYKLCSDTINLNLKLGLFNLFLTHQLGYRLVSLNSGLINSIKDLVEYSNPVFWEDYVSAYFDSGIVRIYRLMDEHPQANSYQTYSNRYLEYYPEKRSKSGICSIDKRLSTIRNRYIAHDDTRFNLEALREGLAVLCDFYTKKVLKSINTLNQMQGLKIVFSYDPRETLLLDKGIAIPILKIIDNELELYKYAGEYPRSEIV